MNSHTDRENEMDYKRSAGTEVRVNGKSATILVEWFNWEAEVIVETTSGRTLRVHPVKVYELDGNHLPYAA
jgi:hypothetical protein